MKFPALSSPVVVGAVALLIVGAFAFCAGERHVEHSDSLKQIAALHARRDTATDTIRVVEHRIVVDTQRVRVTVAVAQQATARFDTAAAALTAAADSGSTGTVPIALALPPIEACHTAIVAKDSVIAAQATVIHDVTVDRDAWKTRALSDEAADKLRAPSRFGFKSGAFVGVAIVAALVHFVR